MSLFNTICEGIITEIRAEDAYKRFYSSIPREDFDRIVGGEENIDKFIQFFLNCVRDGSASVDEAVEAIGAFKKSDQLVKQNVKNKMANGDYEDIDDVVADINYLSNGGGVTSKKSFAKKGYIKLAENDKWIATCTANYLANNHYYGNSHWCTASDRLGRYDGYRYFCDYGPVGGNALIQFKWKGRVMSDEESSGKSFDESLLSDERGYLGDVMFPRYSQFQVEIDKSLRIRQLCDNLDYRMDADDLKSFIGEEMYKVLKDTDKIDFCIKATADFYETEKRYQESVSALIEKKRRRKEAEFQRKLAHLQEVCRENNERKRELVANKWAEFVEKEIYKTDEFAKILMERDIAHKERITEDNLNATYFARAKKHILMSGNRICVSIGPMLGTILAVERFTGQNGLDDVRTIQVIESRAHFNASVCAVYLLENGKMTFSKLLLNSPDKYYEVYTVGSLDMYDASTAERFILLYNYVQNSNRERQTVYDTVKNRLFEVNCLPSVFRLADNTIMFYEEIDDGFYLNYTIYYENSGNTMESGEGKLKAYKLLYKDAVCFTNENEDCQIVFYPREKMMGMKIYSKNKIRSFYETSNEEILVLDFVNGDGENAVFKKTGELIFGFDGQSMTVERDGTCALEYYEREKTRPHGNNFHVVHKMRIVRYPDNTYKKGERDGDLVPCDKYGRTQRDIMSDKNLENWRKAGGYSPETKAQMDKMWADRQEQDTDGSNALNAWNDDDRWLEKRYNGSYGQPFDMRNVMNDLRKVQDIQDDPMWRGFTDLTDPIDSGKDRKEKRPFIRIGKNGKPLDQPWYSEDEIPANLSNRPVPHGRLYEEHNTLISLMERMGLLD